MSAREWSWPVPAALVGLSAIPQTAGTLRLIQLAGSPAIPADHRFAGFPLPLVVHIIGATMFALVGVLQFVPRFRRLTWPGTVVPAGCWPWLACWWRSRLCG